MCFPHKLRIGKWIFPPHPRYLRLAVLQLGGWTWSPYQANYSCSNPLLSALQNGWKLQDKNGFPWLRQLSHSKEFFCSMTLQFNLVCSHPDSAVEMGWEQNWHIVPLQLQRAVSWDPASRGHKIGNVSLQSSHKLEVIAPWFKLLLKFLGQVSGWRYTCWEKFLCSGPGS